MNNLRDKCIAMAVGTVMLGGIATAGATEIPAGNLFYQNGAAISPNVSLIINNPQDMSGGNGVVGPNYWVGGNSPVLDGSVSTIWNAGTFSVGGMCNVAISQGSYDSSNQTFTSVPFGAITMIRIWAAEQPTPSNVWINYPQEVKVAYATTNLGASTISMGYCQMLWIGQIRRLAFSLHFRTLLRPVRPGVALIR